MKKCLQTACLLSMLVLVLTQEKNSSGLLPEPDFLGPVSNAIFPFNIFLADTGIAVRYVLLLVICGWDAFSVCDPSRMALNFFGMPERLPKAVCASHDTAAEVVGYAILRAAENEFSEPAQLYAQVMLDNGYDPEDRSTDAATSIGMGNIIGSRLAEWMGKDGWNSRGDLSRDDFRKPYEDYTGYRSVNSPLELKHPLRWQPLIDADSKFGRFTVQEHVIPFAGYAKPLLLSHEEFVSRHADLPYSDMNATELSGADSQKMKMLVRQVIRASADSTPRQRALAKWFDNKFVSIGVFGAQYRTMLDFDARFFARWNLGEFLSQYDAIVLAWKEKRRIDAVRPRTIIRNFYSDKVFQVFVSPEAGVAPVKGKDWEPLVVTQPHSEFPSASAALCTAFADHGTLMLREHLRANGLSEEPEITLPAILATDEGITELTFTTIGQAGRECGMSRVWAGVHFPPAVSAGESLAEGLGLRGYEFVKQLSEGKVPDSCWWCKN